MKLPGNFGKIEFIVNKEFFYLFYFIGKVKLFNGGPFNFGKKIGKICVIMIEFFAQVIRKIYFDLFIIIMDQFNNDSFNFFYQDLFIILH